MSAAQFVPVSDETRVEQLAMLPSTRQKPLRAAFGERWDAVRPADQASGEVMFRRLFGENRLGVWRNDVVVRVESQGQARWLVGDSAGAEFFYEQERKAIYAAEDAAAQKRRDALAQRRIAHQADEQKRAEEYEQRLSSTWAYVGEHHTMARAAALLACNAEVDSLTPSQLLTRLARETIFEARRLEAMSRLERESERMPDAVRALLGVQPYVPTPFTTPEE